MNTTKTLLVTSPEKVKLRKEKEKLYAKMMEILDSKDRHTRLDEYFALKDQYTKFELA